MKHRIDSLLQGGKDSEAIALAKKANLVCRGTAFIAWDEAEKVPIAQGEVYQPSLRALSALMFSLSRPSPRRASVSVSESKARDYHEKAVLEPCTDEELVDSVSLNLKKTERLTEQLTATIDSVFCAHDAAELSGLLLLRRSPQAICLRKTSSSLGSVARMANA